MLFIALRISTIHPPTILLTPRYRCLAYTTGDGRGGRPPAGAVDRAGSETAFGETGPDFAGVGTAGQGAVGIEDGVAGLNEVGVAWLQSHAFHD